MSEGASFAVVLPAAGSGKRFGGGDKLLADLGGCSVLQRAVGLFARRPEVAQIVLVTGRERLEAYQEHLMPSIKKWKSLAELKLVEGGRERWESVLLGLRAVRKGIAYVAVHDAARPLTPQTVIDAAFAGAVSVGGSVPCLAEPATLKRVGTDQRVSETVARTGLFQAQTPQCFELTKLLRAYEMLLSQGKLEGVTDDAQVFERAQLPVAATVGSAVNLKITTADDIALATALLAASVQPLAPSEVS